MVSGAIGTVLSGMAAGLMSLEDSRHRVAGVPDTGIMHEIVERLGSAEKHYIWKHRCSKVLSILLYSQ